MENSSKFKQFKRIARKTIRAIKDGNQFANIELVAEGEQLLPATRNEKELMGAMFDCDEVLLIVRDIARGTRQFVAFSWLNDPCDCMVDFSVSLSGSMNWVLETA